MIGKATHLLIIQARVLEEAIMAAMVKHENKKKNIYKIKAVQPITYIYIYTSKSFIGYIFHFINLIIYSIYRERV
jgi:hypothetical protein